MYNVFMCTENKLSVGSYQVPEEPDNYKGEENGELQGSVGMAKGNGDDKGDLSFSQKTSERENVCAFGLDETSGGVDPIEYIRWAAPLCRFPGQQHGKRQRCRQL